MVAVNIFSGIPKLRKDFQKTDKTMRLIQRNAMLDASYRTQKVLRLRTYPRAFPEAVNKGHVKAVTALGSPRSRTALSKGKLKDLIEGALKRKRIADVAIFDSTGHGRGSDYMINHAKGGIKRPIDGTNIAVPMDFIKGIRGPRGIRKNYRPRQVLQKKKGSRAKQGFITKINGVRMIVRREGKDRLPITPLYALVPQINIKKSFKFYEDARMFNKIFAVAFVREYQKRMGRTIKKAYY